MTLYKTLYIFYLTYMLRNEKLILKFNQKWRPTDGSQCETQVQFLKHSFPYCENPRLLYCTKLCIYINFYVCYVTKNELLNIIKFCGLQVVHNVKNSFNYCEKTILLYFTKLRIYIEVHIFYVTKINYEILLIIAACRRFAMI